ncbi:hypothetical protein [Azospirillum sp.]|uniref:hypothetical protein n=1 Tax=Azospirillum sp. TaxID=34012 RepID=UPI003D7464DB
MPSLAEIAADPAKKEASIRRMLAMGDGWYAAYRREVEEAWVAGRADREVAEWMEMFGIISPLEAREFI